MELNSNQIQEIIPHRYPMLLVDKITELEPGRHAKGIKCVSSNEQFFCGHFPQEHVMPGVLVLEAMSQVGAVLMLSLEKNKGKIAYFGGVKEARFREKVRPGDVMELEVTVERVKGPIGIGEATATVDGKLVCKATLTFAIQQG